MQTANAYTPKPVERTHGRRLRVDTGGVGSSPPVVRWKDGDAFIPQSLEKLLQIAT